LSDRNVDGWRPVAIAIELGGWNVRTGDLGACPMPKLTVLICLNAVQHSGAPSRFLD